MEIKQPFIGVIAGNMNGIPTSLDNSAHGFPWSYILYCTRLLTGGGPAPVSHWNILIRSDKAASFNSGDQCPNTETRMTRTQYNLWSNLNSITAIMIKYAILPLPQQNTFSPQRNKYNPIPFPWNQLPPFPAFASQFHIPYNKMPFKPSFHNSLLLVDVQSGFPISRFGRRGGEQVEPPNMIFVGRGARN